MDTLKGIQTFGTANTVVSGHGMEQNRNLFLLLGKLAQFGPIHSQLADSFYPVWYGNKDFSLYAILHKNFLRGTGNGNDLPVQFRLEDTVGQGHIIYTLRFCFVVCKEHPRRHDLNGGHVPVRKDAFCHFPVAISRPAHMGHGETRHDKDHIRQALTFVHKMPLHGMADATLIIFVVGHPGKHRQSNHIKSFKMAKHGINMAGVSVISLSLMEDQTHDNFAVLGCGAAKRLTFRFSQDAV